MFTVDTLVPLSESGVPVSVTDFNIAPALLPTNSANGGSEERTSEETIVDSARRYGVVLPHFGTHATRDSLLEGARRAEAFGFDSVWVRDHLVYQPHEHEDPGPNHVDPFVALSAVAAVTSRIGLGTATLIPHRNPVHAALLIGSLDFLAGGERLIIGWGLGNFDHEFDAAGMAGWDRREVLPEQIEIMRALWRGDPVTFAGKYYNVTDIEIHPVPGRDRQIPIWYGGGSAAAVRRAVEYCDGWLPSRMPRRDLRKRVDRMRRLAREAGKPSPTLGVVPYVSPGRTIEDGLAAVALAPLLEDSTKRYQMPESGSFQTIEDLDGALIVGTPDAIIEEVRRYQAEGVEYFVFDVRLRYSDWFEVLQLIGEDVLPHLHREDGRN